MRLTVESPRKFNHINQLMHGVMFSDKENSWAKMSPEEHVWFFQRCREQPFLIPPRAEKKKQPRNPNAHMYVNGTDVETHGHAVTQNTFLQ